MKIAIISPWAVSDMAVGGTERFVIDIAESFSDLENEVDVYMLSGNNYKKNNINYISVDILGNNEYTTEEKLIEVFGDFSKEESYEKIADVLEKLIDINKYDLVQLNSQIFLNAFKNKKRIFTVHSNPFEFEMNFGKESFKYMIKKMQQESNINTNFVIPSNYYMKIYEKITNRKMNFIPHAIEINRLNKEINKDEVYDKYSINEKVKHILLPSRLEPIQKQPMLFLKAFSRIEKEIRDNFQVICTGRDEQYDKYANEIEEYCKNNEIYLKILRFDYMFEAYAIADLIVLPSKSESFGYSALESLSLGIPTILNSIPTFLEIVEGSQNSFLFNETEKSLTEILKKVVDTKLEKKNQSDEWKKRYKLDAFGKNYLKLIDIGR